MQNLLYPSSFKDNEFELDEMDRVIFAKSKDNVYVFLGVYKCAEIKHQDNVKIYKRISKTYKW